MSAQDVLHAAPGKDAAALALDTIEVEIDALEDLARAFRSSVLSAAFAEATARIMMATGRVVVTGMGKSGLIGRKIAATLASTGTPAFYMHPGEASHGDLGMVARDDVVLALSWSGETLELNDILTYCRRFGVPLIAMTSDPGSALGLCANICLALPQVAEACPNQLAPTSSTTLQLVLGDALAVALIGLRGFSANDFRVFHPGGKLGAKLTTVADLMATGDDVPRILPSASLLEAMLEMTAKRFGATSIVDEAGRLLGGFTDGDLRRSLATADLGAAIASRMTHNPRRIPAAMLASEALAIMNEKEISQLFVCEGDDLVGIVHIHDILRAGVA